MSTMKDGKKPLSSKPTMAPMLSEDSIFGNVLAIPPDLEAELKAKGLAWRFVDAKQLYDMQGYHPRGWTPYKRTRTASDTLNQQDFKIGTDPDGVIRRGSLILAVKSKEQAEKHKAFLKEKADRYSGDFNQKKAQELRQYAKENRLDAKIHEGYEDEEEFSS